MTLIELIMVLTILGVVASLGATLVGRLASEQQGNRSRLTLAQSADGAFSQVQDELQQALPNSLRVTSNAAGVWIEWVPVLDAGVARQAADSTGAASDPLETDNPLDNGFDVVGVALATPSGPAWLVWQNLGTPEADAYAGTNRRAGLGISAAGRYVSFTPAGPLPAGSGSGRFYIVGAPVTLACRPTAGGGWEFRRYSGYGWQLAQPVADAALASATQSLMVSGLESCQAAYGSALANMGLLTLRWVAADGSGTRMPMVQQIALDNTP